MAVSTLADLRAGEIAIIEGVSGDDVTKRRLMAAGLVRGRTIAVEETAPLGDPRIYQVLNSRLFLRGKEARNVRVKRFDVDKNAAVASG